MALSIGIIGGGPAGMTAAHLLAQRGVQVEVFERDQVVGGLARSFPLWGHTVDVGPHRFFSKDPRVNRLWLEVVGGDYHMVDRLTRIYYRGRFFHYPLQARNALLNMGLARAMACLSSYGKERILPDRTLDQNNFEGWVISRFGRRLYEMFFKSYSEKLWGIPCTQLDAEFAAQRIKKFSLGEAAKTALGFGKGQHKTLVDRFGYPAGGTGMVYQRMADHVTQHGGKVHCGAAVAGVIREGRVVRGVRLIDGSERRFDHTISTMPLTLMVKSMGDMPASVQQALNTLTYRNTILVYLRVEAADLFPDQWLYIHSPDLLMGRLTNFNNWVPEIRGDGRNTILALEYWCNDGETLWTESDSTLIERATVETRATGLIADAPVSAGKVLRLQRSYPVYARGYKQHLQTVVDYLAAFNGITPIGRYGAFKYNNQDHSILMGVLAVENLLDGKEHDLWAINSDYEYHESSTITEAGLVEG